VGPAVSRLPLSLVLSVALAGFAASDAVANSSGALRTSSGGTGLSTGKGSGGTGLSSHGSAAGSIKGLSGASSTRASTAASGTQNQMTPAKPHATPPAGVRPHTDLAAATKLIGLASGNLIKHSSLYPKMPLPPGSPALSGPVMNKIGASEGGSGSFKAVAGITAGQSNGRVYPKNGGGAGGGRAHASLSGSQSHGVGDLDGEATDTPRRSSGGGLLAWLHGLLTLLGIGAIGYWMWNAAPKGARMPVPAVRA
jgi:hypothetical protein